MSGYRVRRDRILFVDLELTCWEDGVPEGQDREVIEIGLAEVDVPSLRVTRTGSVLVRPVRSEVSPFCESLTGLTAERLRREGRPIREAFASVRKGWGTGSKAWMAWGHDRRAIERECSLAALDSPFSDSFHDIGLQFTLMSGSKSGVGLNAAMSMMGLERHGPEHRGEADAATTAAAWIAMAEAIRSSFQIQPPGDRP